MTFRCLLLLSFALLLVGCTTAEPPPSPQDTKTLRTAATQSPVIVSARFKDLLGISSLGPHWKVEIVEVLKAPRASAIPKRPIIDFYSNLSGSGEFTDGKKTALLFLLPDPDSSQRFIDKTPANQPLLPASRSNVNFLRKEMADNPR
jgi:hypothetical protein